MIAGVHDNLIGTATRLLVGGYQREQIAGIRTLFPELDFAVQDLGTAPLDEFDVVMPLHDKEYAPLWKSAYKTFIVPARKTVALCRDKVAMNRWVADTFGPSLLPAAGFERIPAILKPVQSEWGVGCELLLDPADRTRIESMATGDFFWQEFIQGTQEYALHFLAIQGSILFSWLVKYVFETCLPIKSKRYPPVAIMSEPPAPVPGELARMISKLSYSGTGCVNFKYTAQGDLKFLELNPRFGGSLLSNFRGYCEAYIAAVSSLAGVHLKFSSVAPSP